MDTFKQALPTRQAAPILPTHTRGEVPRSQSRKDRNRSSRSAQKAVFNLEHDRSTTWPHYSDPYNVPQLPSTGSSPARRSSSTRKLASRPPPERKRSPRRAKASEEARVTPSNEAASSSTTRDPPGAAGSKSTIAGQSSSTSAMEVPVTAGDKVQVNESNEQSAETPPAENTPADKLPAERKPAPLSDASKELTAKVLEAARGELFYTLTKESDETKPTMSILNLATLQRMSLHALQHRLAERAYDILENSDAILHDIGNLNLELRHYCEAVQNMEYMKSRADLDDIENDPFLITSFNTLGHQTLKSTNLIPKHMSPHGTLPDANDADDVQLWGASRTASNEEVQHHEKINRLVHASGGGAALIAPMLIMIYVPGTTASVVTTCAFVVAFAAAIAVQSRLGPNDILAVTSAYAAVLVVFVGVRLTPGA